MTRTVPRAGAAIPVSTSAAVRSFFALAAATHESLQVRKVASLSCIGLNQSMLGRTAARHDIQGAGQWCKAAWRLPPLMMPLGEGTGRSGND